MDEKQALLEAAGLLPAAAEIRAYLEGFDVSVNRGFVPQSDPVRRLAHAAFEPYEALADSLPQLLQAGQLRPAIDALDASIDRGALHGLADHASQGGDNDEGGRRRALLLFAGLANAYVWGGGPDVMPRDRIPACLAVPLHRVAAALETEPILSHQSNCLYNFQRQGEDAAGPAELRAEELDVTFSFTGERDEAMFYLLTLEIEAVGGLALADLEAARRLVVRLSSLPSSLPSPSLTPDPSALLAAAHAWLAGALGRVKGRVDRMRGIMESMPAHVRPAFFYHRIRPYLTGWKGNPTLPEGVVYEGVVDGEGRRLHLSGGSAAQSSIVAALDLYLGLDLGGPDKPSHTSYAFIRSMRAYMPRGHRRFLDALETEMASTSIRAYVAELLAQGQGEAAGAAVAAAVVAAYDACVDSLVAFRRSHLSIVRSFILRQQQQQQQQSSLSAQEGNDAAGLERAAGGKGTGGMPLVEFLTPLKEETEAARLLVGKGRRVDRDGRA